MSAYGDLTRNYASALEEIATAVPPAELFDYVMTLVAGLREQAARMDETRAAYERSLTRRGP